MPLKPRGGKEDIWPSHSFWPLLVSKVPLLGSREIMILSNICSHLHAAPPPANSKLVVSLTIPSPLQSLYSQVKLHALLSTFLRWAHCSEISGGPMCPSTPSGSPSLQLPLQPMNWVTLLPTILFSVLPSSGLYSKGCCFCCASSRFSAFPHIIFLAKSAFSSAKSAHFLRPRSKSTFSRNSILTPPTNTDSPSPLRDIGYLDPITHTVQNLYICYSLYLLGSGRKAWLRVLLKDYI